MNEQVPANSAMNLPADMSAFDMSGFDTAITELAPGEPVVRFQNMKWIFQRDEKLRLEPGQQLVVNLFETMRGWLRFEGEGSDAKLAERRLGRLMDGFRPQPREELGLLDKEKWKKDSKGEPMDPWVHTWQFPAILKGEKGNYKVLVTGTSGGWERCLGALMQDWRANMATNVGKTPVVALGIRENVKTAHGDRDFPKLTIVDWIDPTTVQVVEEAEETADQEPKQPKF